MSPISRDDLHRIFKNLDKNNNGRISIHELQNLPHRIGIQTTLEELEKIVGRNNLDFIEFLFFYEAMIEARNFAEPDGCDDDDDLWKAFEVFDVNSDGLISCDSRWC